jgi:hypothetical protein
MELVRVTQVEHLDANLYYLNSRGSRFELIDCLSHVFRNETLTLKIKLTYASLVK